MPRPRTPKAKATATGRTLINPGRFKKRNEPTNLPPIGNAPIWMNEKQRRMWDTFRSELFWLNYSHRCILEIACIIRTRLHDGDEVGVNAANLLRQTLGQLGASPADVKRITLPDVDKNDPADKYFR